MRSFRSVCCSLVAAAALAGGIRHETPRVPAQVNVHFRFQDSVVTLHEPVVVFFEVHNGLAQPITVEVGALVRQFFDFSLTTPSGQVFRKDPYGGLVDIVTAGTGKIKIEPGSDYKEPLVMNQWFNFANQGTYTLTSRLTSQIETADGSFQAESQTAQLLITARDPTRLKKICADLEQQAEIATTVEAAQFPALALSYVNDPIAVPYLARLLSAHTLAYAKAVAGLDRIGNDDAIEALLSAPNENWGDTAELATRSLARMQDRIANPRLRETVKNAVERSSERARDELYQKADRVSRLPLPGPSAYGHTKPNASARRPTAGGTCPTTTRQRSKSTRRCEGCREGRTANTSSPTTLKVYSPIQDSNAADACSSSNQGRCAVNGWHDKLVAPKGEEEDLVSSHSGLAFEHDGQN